jgi:Tfp pilus assembly protein PilN
MINLMPPAMKEQIRYAKLNRLVLRYVKVTVLVVIVLGGIFGWALWQLQIQAATVDTDMTNKEATIAALNRDFTPKAQEASDRLTAIKFVLTNQTRFSAVIADIAKVVPQGVSIDSMTLTGSDAEPVRIGFNTQTYQGALAFRNALMTSPRIAAADLEVISANTTAPGFSAAVIIGFKPGQAK